MFQEDIKLSLLGDAELIERKLGVCLRLNIVLIDHKVFYCFLVGLQSIFGNFLEVYALWVYLKLVPHFSVSFLKALSARLVCSRR